MEQAAGSFRDIKLDAWSKIPDSTKAIIAVLGGMLVLFVFLILIRVGLVVLPGSVGNHQVRANSTGINSVDQDNAQALLSPTDFAPGTPFLTALENIAIQSGSDAKILGYLESGQSAEIIGVSPDKKWWVIKVSFFETGRGWVNANGVQAENAENVAIVSINDEIQPQQSPEAEFPEVVAVVNVNVRNGPGTEYKKIGLMEKGQKAKVVGIEPERFWLAIKMPGSEDERGWISVDYIAPQELDGLSGLPVLEPRPIEGSSIVPVPTPGVPLLSATYVVNIRSSPGTQYEILGKLEQGQQAEVIGVSADGLWWAIKVVGVNNEQGWVAADYVQAENTTGIPILQ